MRAQENFNSVDGEKEERGEERYKKRVGGAEMKVKVQENKCKTRIIIKKIRR